MKSLIIKGPFKGATGYDHHVREFTKELVRQGIEVQLIDFPKWSEQKLAKLQQDQWYETLNRPVDANIALHFTMPHQVEIVRNKLNANFTMFEASRIPQNWLQHNLRHDLVILPTESSKQTWMDSGYPEERIRLCPLGVNTEIFHSEIEPLPLKDRQGRPIIDYKTRILNISELIPRKNLIGLLRIWTQSTSKTDDAILIIKTNCPWRRWLYKFFLDVKLMERQICKSRKQAAPILFIINQRFSVADMPRLYAAATHYWSMSYGEGWDLCMMEAAASCLHLIAPDHSAYTAYLNPSVADMIPSKKVPAKFRWAAGLHKLFQDAEWWQPDEIVAADYIHNALKNHNTMKSSAAQSLITQEYTWQKATSRLIKILRELENSFFLNPYPNLFK